MSNQTPLPQRYDDPWLEQFWKGHLTPYSQSRDLRLWGWFFVLVLFSLMWMKGQKIIPINAGHYGLALSLYCAAFALGNLKKSSHCTGIVLNSLLGVAISAYYINDVRLNLDDERLISGSAMLFLIVLAAAFKLKKYLAPFKKWGRSRLWMHIHIYSGIAAMILFMFHLDLSLPNGLFSYCLFLLFTLFIALGILGVNLQRVIPVKLADLDTEVIYEKIPQVVESLRLKINDLMDRGKGEPISKTLSSFCEQYVLPFFEGPKPSMQYFFSSSAGLPERLHKFDNLQQFLNDDEKLVLVEIKKLYKEKQQLDVHASLQWFLRQWLWLHIVMASLLIFMILYHLGMIFIF
ncbi:MAG: hypothetical protein G3M78_03820 [Candidatus Nitrohelix vancouverensis]|uniref:Uncharacterized protein n=1 Tax=Candidatus Nitrohelix vancouverensis TaxID=2705534 RepID=A0A7T0C1C0_9BACT|nr:MAG: hypothetical protein G3M78_03820 [Candidatus Nitrohelix vancouverensis]